MAGLAPPREQIPKRRLARLNPTLTGQCYQTSVSNQRSLLPIGLAFLAGVGADRVMTDPKPPPRTMGFADTSFNESGSIDNGPTYFANCSEARAAGAAPVRIGDPGYASHLDRDDDGVGCE